MYFILILSFNINALDVKDARKYSPDERRIITINLIREKEYDMALSFAPDKNLLGCIKILQGNFLDGIEYIKESALKGEIFSCDLFILFNLKVEEKELVKYIEKRLEVYEDSVFSFKSPYLSYLTEDFNIGEIQNSYADSIVKPYIIYRSGIILPDEHPEKKGYLERLLDSFPGSIPAVVARNIVGVFEKENED